MKAINLIPADAGRLGGAPRELPQSPALGVLGLLAVALALVTIYVLTNNTISDRKAKLVSVQQQAAQLQAQAAQLQRYTQFVQLAQQRQATVRQLASSRFDWHAALTDLSKVVPANTSLQSLVATVAPGVGVSGPGGGAGGTTSLRSAISAPAFELRGCTSTQDDVARLMSRLRVMNGVTRVTLADSSKQDATQAAAGVGSAAGSGAAGGCATNAPTFDLVVFFQPLPGAAASAGVAGSAPPATGTTTTTGAQTTTTTSTPATTPAPAAAGSTPVSTGTGGSK